MFYLEHFGLNVGLLAKLLKCQFCFDCTLAIILCLFLEYLILGLLVFQLGCELHVQGFRGHMPALFSRALWEGSVSQGFQNISRPAGACAGLEIMKAEGRQLYSVSQILTLARARSMHLGLHDVGGRGNLRTPPRLEILQPHRLNFGCFKSRRQGRVIGVEVTRTALINTMTAQLLLIELFEFQIEKLNRSRWPLNIIVHFK